MAKRQSLRYPVEVFYSDEDGGFIAIAKDLPGCSAFGKTQASALAVCPRLVVRKSQAGHNSSLLKKWQFADNAKDAMPTSLSI